MKALTTIFSTLTTPFKFGPTATGLDVLKKDSISSTVANELVRSGHTPASRDDIEQAFQRVTGCQPNEHQLLDAEALLLSFGMLQV